jgi:hypothetical protein
MKDTSAGCGGLEQGTKNGHVQFYIKEQQPQPYASPTAAGDSVSYLVKILTGLGRTPTDYFTISPGSNPVIMRLGQSILDPDDDKTWDWYEVWCSEAGDVALPDPSEYGHVKVYPKEPLPIVIPPNPNTSVSYLVKVLTGLGRTPKDYVQHNPTIIPIGASIVDPDDGKTWDWYNVWCPTGPPCDDLRKLVTDQDLQKT